MAVQPFFAGKCSAQGFSLSACCHGTGYPCAQGNLAILPGWEGMTVGTAHPVLMLLTTALSGGDASGPSVSPSTPRSQ